MMIARKYNGLHDAVEIEAIYQRCHHGRFSLPDLDHVVSSVVIEQNGVVIGYGALEAILEGMMIVDTHIPIRMRIEALRKIIDSGIVASKLNGYERFYSFPSPESFGEILVKHFNFQPAGPIFHLELK